MNRLTIKNGNYYCSPDSETSLKPVYDKLGILEDIEEQLGCPLEVVYNAQVNGFYGKTKDNEIYFYNPVEDFIIIDFRLGRLQVALSTDFYNVMTFYLSDHKKTWWLSKKKEE